MAGGKGKKIIAIILKDVITLFKISKEKVIGMVVGR